MKPEFSCCNPNASEKCVEIMKFFESIYGKHILSSQHMNIRSTFEYENIHNITGEYPAIVGVDLSSVGAGAEPFTGDPENEMAKNVGSVKMAAEWAKEHGVLLTVCWHWSTPSHYKRSHSFYKRFTDFNLSKAIKEKGEDYRLLLSDMDKAAEHLKYLRDMDIPVLFRPLHEANGTHFWWGNEPAPFIELYRTMYDRFTNLHKLNNLIWVWNGEEPQLYPGDGYVDISGLDTYNYSLGAGSLAEEYRRLDEASGGKKPLALTEISTVPDMDSLISENVPWLWFMLWNGMPDDAGRNTHELIRNAYRHPYTVNENELKKMIKLY